ncbi:N-acetyltransferase esco2 [Rhizoclosmatium sp. JEL0117]|nr:N-acetyltransferase esco2 [Rhizoclosmatium sp. JEL0117]
MRFVRSAHDDDVIHAKFHASVIGGIDYNGYANDVVVHDLLSEKIILITIASASPAQKKKCLEILDVVNQELGAVPISPESLARCKLFLYIAKSKVIGCVLAETIESGFRLSAGDIDGVDENEDLISCDSSNSEPAVCGISRVWVSKKHRRNGIAIKLLDACRRRFLFGCTLDKEAMAFSQPTVEGRKLATQYFGKSDFLIYTIGA